MYVVLHVSDNKFFVHQINNFDDISIVTLQRFQRGKADLNAE